MKALLMPLSCCTAMHVMQILRPARVERSRIICRRPCECPGISSSRSACPTATGDGQRARAQGGVVSGHERGGRLALRSDKERRAAAHTLHKVELLDDGDVVEGGAAQRGEDVLRLHRLVRPARRQPPRRLEQPLAQQQLRGRRHEHEPEHTRWAHCPPLSSTVQME